MRGTIRVYLSSCCLKLRNSRRFVRVTSHTIFSNLAFTTYDSMTTYCHVCSPNLVANVTYLSPFSVILSSDQTLCLCDVNGQCISTRCVVMKFVGLKTNLATSCVKARARFLSEQNNAPWSNQSILKPHKCNTPHLSCQIVQQRVFFIYFFL